MCHLILALPFAALPVLWRLPGGEGIAVYAVALAVTGVVYWLAVKAMRAPVQIGTETLLHAAGTVRAVDGRKGAIWVASELWSADFAEGGLAVGDAVEVVGIAGLRLVVRKGVPARAASLHSQPVH